MYRIATVEIDSWQKYFYNKDKNYSNISYTEDKKEAEAIYSANLVASKLIGNSDTIFLTFIHEIDYSEYIDEKFGVKPIDDYFKITETYYKRIINGKAKENN